MSLVYLDTGKFLRPLRSDVSIKIWLGNRAWCRMLVVHYASVSPYMIVRLYRSGAIQSTIQTKSRIILHIPPPDPPARF